jgi:hypothetical protein
VCTTGCWKVRVNSGMIEWSSQLGSYFKVLHRNQLSLVPFVLLSQSGWQILIWNYRVFLLRIPDLSLRYIPILPRILINAHLCLEHHKPLRQIIYLMFCPLLNAEYKCYPRPNGNSLLLTNLYQEIECKKWHPCQGFPFRYPFLIWYTKSVSSVPNSPKRLHTSPAVCSLKKPLVLNPPMKCDPYLLWWAMQRVSIYSSWANTFMTFWLRRVHNMMCFQ